MRSQGLQEFHVNATRKLAVPLDRDRARRIVETYAAWAVHVISLADILDAIRLEDEHQISFWDGLIVVAATRSGAKLLLTEDLNHDQVIRGVRIVNPLR